jgi:O-succinylbenzoic acid--CoA ligase
MIPTGGTGGKVRFAIHDPKSLRAAALSLSEALAARGLPKVIHGASMTPPWHVSGLMPAIRARETGGTFVVLDGRFAPDKPLPAVEMPAGGTRMASLVPAQLDRLLSRPDGEAWIHQWDVILLGGSSVPASQLELIRKHQLPVALSYGMTETAAVVAVAWPEDLGEGEVPAGRPLPGVIASTKEGQLWIEAPGLCHGHWPAAPMSRPFATGDLGEILPDGRIRVTGRVDRLIATGGEKVDPSRVEAVLTAPGLARAALVMGMPDEVWGHLLVAMVIAHPSQEAALRAAAAVLEPAARPRRYVFVDALPFDARGKFDPGQAGRLIG